MVDQQARAAELAPSPEDDAGAGARRTGPLDGDAARPLVDVLHLVVLAWALWWLADNDGGLRVTETWPLAVLVLASTPLAADEWRRAPTPVRWLLVALPVGALLSFAFALDRARFAADAITFGMLVPMLLVASRLARRRATLLALGAVVVLSLLAFSWLAGLKWWAWTEAGQPRWELLSWRNQGGALAAGLGVWLAGIAIAGRQAVGVVAVPLAALGVAGAWLSSSRAAGVFVALGLLALVVHHVIAADERRQAGLRAAARVGATAVLAAVVVAALQSTLPASASAPISSRPEAVSTHAVARVNHWRAAVGLFAHRPLTGTGLGSYRALMTTTNPPEGNLTAAAHSEWLEALAEGGLAFGAPLVGLAALGAVGVLRRPRRRHEADEADEVSDLDRAPAADGATVDEPAGHDRSDAAGRDPLGLEAGIRLGAVGALVVVLGHASIDFDFRYLTLASLAVVAGGVVLEPWTRRATPARPGRGLAVVALLPAMLLLGTGLLLFRAEVTAPRPNEVATPDQAATARPPWETLARTGLAEALARGGELEAARVAAEGPAAWNPGDPLATMTLSRIEYLLGEIDAAELVSRLDAPPTTLNQWARTAEALFARGDLEEADAVAATAISFHPTYQVWGIAGTVADAWRVRMEVALRTDSCAAARSLLDQAEAQGFDRFGAELPRLRGWLDGRCPTA